VPDPSSYSLYDLQQEPDPVLEAAAIIVSSTVVVRGEEGIYEVAMSAMNLYEVEPYC
jgi:hypothetical protein